MSTPPADTFDQPQGYHYGQAPTSPGDSSSGRRPAALVAAAIVATLAIGGGAFAVSRVLGDAGAGEQPAAALPAGTAAYLRMDTDPSVGQKIAAVRFLAEMDPETAQRLREGDLRQELFEAAAEEDEAFAAIDYERDIQPWLGDRAAVGVVPRGQEEPMVAVALEVTDQEAADEGLERLRAAAQESAGSEVPLAWFFHDDYAVVTTPESVDALRQEVEAGTLAADPTFTEDIAALGDQGVLSFWVDSGALNEAIEAAPERGNELDGFPGGADSGFPGLLGGQFGDTASQGRVAAAVRFGEDHLEVHGVTRGAPAELEGGDSAHLVLDLPDDTAVAVGLEHGDQLVGEVYEQFRTALPEETAEAEAQAAAEGWTLPEDIQVLVGQSLALAVGPGIVDAVEQEAFTELPFAYRVQTDTEAAGAVLDRALALDPSSADLLVRREDDGVLTLGLSQAYVDAVVAGGSLGEQGTFQSAVPGAEDADVVLYVALDAFESSYLPLIEDPEVRDGVEQISAVGMSSRWVGDGNGEFTLRVVSRE